MTIDEAIKEEQTLYDIAKDKYEKFGIKNCVKRMEEHKQYIEWLEELKILREEKSEFQIIAKDIAEYNYEMGMENGYNKAVDDFAERLKPIIDEKIKGWTNSDDLRRWCERSIDEIAEQLKEMESN